MKWLSTINKPLLIVSVGKFLFLFGGLVVRSSLDLNRDMRRWTFAGMILIFLVLVMVEVLLMRRAQPNPSQVNITELS